MIVITIIALLAGAIIFGLGSISKTALRSSAVKVAAAVKTGYSWATMHGRAVRLAMDMDEGKFWLEESKDQLLLDLSDTSGSAGSEEGPDGGMGDGGTAGPIGLDLGELGLGLDNLGFAGAMGAGGAGGGGAGAGGEGAGGAAAGGQGMDVNGMSGFLFFDLSHDPFLAQLLPQNNTQNTVNPVKRGYPPPRFHPLPGSRGKKRELESGVRFKAVYTPHEELPREDGTAFLFFFPGGRTEESIIQVTDSSERVISLKVHPLTGRTDLEPGEVEPEGKKLGDLNEVEK